MIKHVSLAATLSAFLSFQVACAEPLAPVAEQNIDALVNAKYPALLANYKDIHQHPELGFQETRTAARLAREMRRTGSSRCSRCMPPGPRAARRRISA
jgi:hypothetical protein